MLFYCIFLSFRVYGVLIFVYVASIEQIMLYNTIINYIINAVVVLVVAEIDELAFLFLSKNEMKNNNEDEDSKKIKNSDFHSDGYFNIIVINH